jgi:hypothetical protein
VSQVSQLSHLQLERSSINVYRVVPSVPTVPTEQEWNCIAGIARALKKCVDSILTSLIGGTLGTVAAERCFGNAINGLPCPNYLSQLTIVPSRNTPRSLPRDLGPSKGNNLTNQRVMLRISRRRARPVFKPAAISAVYPFTMSESLVQPHF